MQARAARRGHNPYIDEYDGDGFVVDDDESDGFEPIREASRTTSKSKARGPLGPPITRDGIIDAANLSDVHRDVMEVLVPAIKKLEANIKVNKSLSRPLFTELQMRQMAIEWTTTEDEILAIRGIAKDRVEPYASKFAALVKQYHIKFEQMMGRRDENDVDLDDNHQNVIDLISSDEDNDDDVSDNVDVSDEEPSKFFPTPAVQAFNDSLPAPYAQKPPFKAGAPSSRSNPRGKNGPWQSGRSGKGKYRKASGSGSGGSGSTSRAPAAAKAGVQKKRNSSGQRNSHGSTTAAKAAGGIFARFEKKGSRGGKGGGGNFGTMPT